MVSLDPELIAQAKTKNINFSQTLEEALRFKLSDTSPLDDKIFRQQKEIERLAGETERAQAGLKALYGMKAALAADAQKAQEAAAIEAKRKADKTALVRAQLINWVKSEQKINWQFYLERYGITEQEILEVVKNEGSP